MDEITLRGKLLINDSVNINGLNLKQYTIKEILNMGVDKFDDIRNFVWYDVKSIDKKYKAHIDDYMYGVKELLMKEFPQTMYFRNYTTFDLVCYEQTFNNMFIHFLNTFTTNNIVSIEHIPLLDHISVVFDDTNVTMIKRNDFKDIMNTFAILNFAMGFKEDNVFMEHKKDSEVERYEAEVADMWEQFGFKKEKPKITLYSIMEWLVNDGRDYTHENIGNRTIYQVMSSYNRINHLEYCDTINQIRCNGMLGKMDKKDLEKATPSFEIYR